MEWNLKMQIHPDDYYMYLGGLVDAGIVSSEWMSGDATRALLIKFVLSPEYGWEYNNVKFWIKYQWAIMTI